MKADKELLIQACNNEIVRNLNSITQIIDDYEMLYNDVDVVKCVDEISRHVDSLKKYIEKIESLKL